MNPGKLKLSQLRALVAIAECGNFSEAAMELNLSQSTVSHAIANLENALHTPVVYAFLDALQKTGEFARAQAG